MQMFLTPEEKIIEQLRTENAALKEQMAHIKEIEFPTKCIAIADIWKNKVTLLDETIAQQAEAIRLKDEALKLAAETFAGYAIHHGNKDVPDLDKIVDFYVTCYRLPEGVTKP